MKQLDVDEESRASGERGFLEHRGNRLRAAVRARRIEEFEEEIVQELRNARATCC